MPKWATAVSASVLICVNVSDADGSVAVSI
jgi:hypothetical protein